jgi:hypothetical protein
MRMLLRLLSIILVIVLRFHPEIAKTIQMIQLLVGFFFFFFFFFFFNLGFNCWKAFIDFTITRRMMREGGLRAICITMCM